MVYSAENVKNAQEKNSQTEKQRKVGKLTLI